MSGSFWVFALDAASLALADFLAFFFFFFFWVVAVEVESAGISVSIELGDVLPERVRGVDISEMVIVTLSLSGDEIKSSKGAALRAI